MTTHALINLVTTLDAIVRDGDQPFDLRRDAQTSLAENITELSRRAEYDDAARRFVHHRASSSETREGERHEQDPGSSSSCARC